MNILVTGNQGYIGTVLVERLLREGYAVSGLDVGFFESCHLESFVCPGVQINRDVRDVTEGDLLGVDAIIHLAALSNDPLGEFSPGLTEAINYRATVRLASLAKSAGVKRFVYASSQSMYGIATTDQELEEDNGDKNPVTTYAKTKWSAEQDLIELRSDKYVVVCFRPSTVFGASPRIRCDIVYNNLVACAYTTGKIEIKSDGTPWRPVVHIDDVCSALIAGLRAPTELVNGRSYNVGIPNGNFTVRQLAEAAQSVVPGSSVIFTGEHGGDSRSYRVSFSRILTELSEWYVPSWDLDRGGRQLVEFFDRVNFSIEDFRGAQTNRLIKLKALDHQQLLDGNLRFKG